MIRLIAEAYRMHREVEDANTNGMEMGVGATDMEWSWGLEEVNPLLSGGFYKSVGRLDGYRADLGFVLRAGSQDLAPIGDYVAMWLEGYGSWGYYRETKGMPRQNAYSVDGGIGGQIDVGAWSLSLRLRALDAYDAGLRGWGELALRFWPDGARERRMPGSARGVALL